MSEKLKLEDPLQPTADDAGVLRAYLDATAEWVFAKDTQYRLLFVNRAFAAAQGHRPEDMIGRPDTDFWPLEFCIGDAAKGLRGFHADDDEAFAGRTLHNPNDPATLADGQIRIFDTIKQPLFDAQGRVYGVLGVARDVTEQRQVEAALRTSETRFRLLVDHAPVSFYVHDGKTVLFANRAVAKLLGFATPSELVGLPVISIVHPDDRRSLRERIERLRTETREGFNTPILGRFVRTDGGSVHAEIVATPTEFEGRPAILVVALDVTDRERAEQAVRERDAALRRSEAQLSEAQRIARLGSWESNLIDHRLTWSDELFRIFELDRDRVQASREAWVAMVHPEDRATVLAAYEHSVTTRMPAAFSYRLQMPDGRIKHVHQHVHTEYDEAGQPMRSIGTVQDVTEREQATADRLMLEAQLQHVQRVEALGTLAAGIAHDFNNILTAITANAAFALQEVGPEHRARVSLGEISVASARAAELVRQILTVGRRQAQRMSVVSLPSIIDEAHKLLRATLPAEIEIVRDIAADTPNISADATQIHQVLINLCTNAWHAMVGRAGRIEIRTARVTPAEATRLHSELRPGEYARVTVSDTGSGMDRATLERIFDPFFTTKAVGEGSGLGLAVVHGIVKGHGGAVTVTSEEGQGTTFQLYFPAVDAPADAAAHSAPQLPARGEVPPRVLLVDDEVAIVGVFTRALERLGFQVTPFTRPSEALAAIRASGTAFDIVVTDHRMPEVTGIQLAREIRRLALRIPIVMMSGHLSDELLAEGAKVEITRFISKPCSVESLGEVLLAVNAARDPGR